MASRAANNWTAIGRCLDNLRSSSGRNFSASSLYHRVQQKGSPLMKNLSKALLCVALAVSALSGQAPSKKAPAGSPPPLIDRELIFGNPEISGAQLSPNGKYLAFQKPWKDTRNVYVKGVDEPFSAARLLTAETKRPIAGYFWSRDSKYILYVKDNDGDENYNVYAV